MRGCGDRASACERALVAGAPRADVVAASFQRLAVVAEQRLVRQRAHGRIAGAAALSSVPVSADAAHTTHALPAQSGLASFAAAATSSERSFSRSAAQSAPVGAVCLPVAADAQRPAFALQMPRSRASCTPLSPGRYKLQLSVGQEVHDELEQLRDLLRHRVPDGGLASIVALAVDGLLDKTEQRFARTGVRNRPPRARSAPPDKPRAQPPTAGKRVENSDGAENHVHHAVFSENHVDRLSTADRRVTPLSAADGPVDGLSAAGERLGPLSASDRRVDAVGASQGLRARGPRSLSRYVPRAVRREVYARDGGQCTFVSSDCQRCAARDCSRSIITTHPTRSEARQPSKICVSCAVLTMRCTPSAISVEASCFASCGMCVRSVPRLHPTVRPRNRRTRWIEPLQA